ncbi:MAG: YHS domain-containing (seleno)protein [Rhodothalassiaceae bacterium]
MRFIVTTAILTAFLFLLAPVSSADAEPPISTGFFSDLALDGYDAVAYFTDGEAVKGSKEFSLEYLGATWRFASAAHRDAFRADPQAYAPQYGGYCAWAMAEGKYAPSDPHRWRIVDGKLYLNYDKKIQERWERDIPGFIARADANWSELNKP